MGRGAKPDDTVDAGYGGERMHVLRDGAAGDVYVWIRRGGETGCNDRQQSEQRERQWHDMGAECAVRLRGAADELAAECGGSVSGDHTGLQHERTTDVSALEL